MDIDVTGSRGGRGTTIGSAGMDTGNQLEALADAIGEALGIAPEPGSVFAPAPSKAPQWQIEAGS